MKIINVNRKIKKMISIKTGAEVNLKFQYIKDISFENPKAPNIYSVVDMVPKIDVFLDVQVNDIKDNLYEVQLIASTEAKFGKETIFVLEVCQCGIFEIKNVEGDLLDKTLFIDCPYTLFPFLRRVVADITVSASMPPLILELADFEELYKNRK